MRTAVVLAIALISAVLPASAQGLRFDIYPTVLYPGDNIITIRSSAGIEEILVRHTPNVEVAGDGRLACPKEHELHVRLKVAHEPAELELIIVDCRGQRYSASLPNNNTWTLDLQRYGTVESGRTKCQSFTIRTDRTATLDSVSVTDPRLHLRFFSDLPYTIRGGTVYRYEVCFDATEPGTYKFPVITWMRRDQPSGGMTNYPVADTGIVRVVLPPGERPPEPEIAEEPEPPVSDPTTFRSVALPNAIIPPRGRFVLGVYDFLGLMAGYSVTDNLMLLTGGALPMPDDWGGVRGTMYGAWSIGAKAGIAIPADENGTRSVAFAAGFQWARSIYDEEATPGVVESKITLLVPWGSLSVGSDDSRISLTGGYAMKHHVKPEISFDENAAILGLGGDFRFERHWKFAAEGAWMQTLGTVPIVITARYFGQNYAIDFGMAFLGIGSDPPSLPLAPVLAGVFVF